MNKLLKKVVSMFLVFAMVLSVGFINTDNVYAASSSSVLKSWNGTFEKSINNTTGWCTDWVNFYKPNKNGRKSTSKWGIIKAKQPFIVMSISGDYAKVKYGRRVGFIYNKYMMINLPDVLPSIQYNLVNAYSCMSKCMGKSISGLTGKKFYSTKKVYNKKIGRNEWIVPMLYTTAVKIAKAQKVALKKGYGLKIYDAYRPYSVTRAMYPLFSNWLNKNKRIRNSAFTYQYDQSWFLAQNKSTHNVASAIDVSMVNYSNGKELKMPTAYDEMSKRAVKYANSSTKNAKSGYASTMTSAAKTMNSIFIDAGMSTLASEWWHFQDQAGFEFNRDLTDNLTNWYPTSLAYK